MQEEGEGRSWESRHLLQEVVFYGNESRIYTEPEKNCTEPGRTDRNSRVVIAPMDVIGWIDVFIHSKDHPLVASHAKTRPVCLGFFFSVHLV